jgi:hypothetical protein
MLILHVAIFAISGAAGLISIRKNLELVRSAIGQAQRNSLPDKLLNVWMLLYGFVGTQMAHNLSPFINAKGPAVFFPSHTGNFYIYLFKVVSEWMQP